MTFRLSQAVRADETDGIVVEFPSLRDVLQHAMDVCPPAEWFHVWRGEKRLATVIDGGMDWLSGQGRWELNQES